MHRIKKRRITYLNTFFSFAVCLTVTKDPTPVTNEAPRNLRFAQIYMDTIVQVTLTCSNDSDAKFRFFKIFKLL